jgi:hypothetical protein
MLSVNVQEMLLGAVVVLGGLVWNSQDKRITKLEEDSKVRSASEQTLREAVIKLTVTVEHLMAALGGSHRGDGE